MTEGQDVAQPSDEQPKPATKRERRHLRELARKATEDCIAALRAAVKTGPPNVAVAAAQALLDRGWGRPSQTPASDGPAPGQNFTVTLTPPEHRTLAQSLEARIDALITPAPAEAPAVAPTVPERPPAAVPPPQGPALKPQAAAPPIVPPVPPRSAEPPAPPVRCAICGDLNHDARRCPQYDAFMDSQPWQRVSEGDMWR